MITQQEAIDIARELESTTPKSERYRQWPTNQTVKSMMDWYNDNRRTLKAPPAFYDGHLVPYSMNCRPCIGKVVFVLLYNAAQKELV